MDYNTKRWEHVRNARLRKDEYICQECKRYGKTMEATTVHHIIPADKCIGEYRKLLYDSRNLISLCNGCHERMHMRQNRELSDAGLQLLRRKWSNIPPLYLAIKTMDGTP